MENEVEIFAQNGKNIPCEPKIGGFETFSAMLGSASKSLEKIKSKKMEEFGLSGTHTLCLLQLYECPDGLMRTELANRLGVDRAQITRVVGELLSKGFATEEGRGSGYRKKCRLTEKGEAVSSEIMGTVERINKFVSGDIPPDRLKEFYDIFGEICEKLKSAEELL